MKGQTEIILLKLGESVLKGQNRRAFEQRLVSNIRSRHSNIGNFEVYVIQSTVYIHRAEGVSEEQFERALCDMESVYGVVGICRAAECGKNMPEILLLAPEYCAPSCRQGRFA